VQLILTFRLGCAAPFFLVLECGGRWVDRFLSLAVHRLGDLPDGAVRY
jgi:hypothetical protein